MKIYNLVFPFSVNGLKGSYSNHWKALAVAREVAGNAERSAAWNLCTQLQLPIGAESISCNGATCTTVCESGKMTVGHRRTKCRFKKNRGFFWKRKLSDCIMQFGCSPLNPSSTDPNLNITCSDNSKGFKTCQASCPKGMNLLGRRHNLIMKCKCQWSSGKTKKECGWIGNQSWLEQTQIENLKCEGKNTGITESVTIGATSVALISAPITTAAVSTPVVTTSAMTTPSVVTAPVTTPAMTTVTSISTEGELTVYSNSPAGGNCDLPWDFYLNNFGLTMFAAIPRNPGTPNDAYDGGANCARCAKVRCSNTQSQFHGACAGGVDTIVMLTDSCPSCPQLGDIDLSNAAWDSVTGNDGASRYDGSWEYIDCPSEFASGNTKMRFKGGSSKWWMAVQAFDFTGRVTSIQIKHANNGNQFKEMNKGIDVGIDGFWFHDEPKTAPVTIKFKIEKLNGQQTTYEKTFQENEIIENLIYDL